MEEKPLVSILMTAYNREQFIGEAIESVLASTYENFELIVVDDTSTDNTVEIAQSYAAKDTRISVYINEKNIGDYPNRNKAASYAYGEFIMFVDSDDKILLDGLERCVNSMQQFPQAKFGMQLHGDEDVPFFLEPRQAISLHFFQKPFLLIGPGGTIIRRSFFEAIGKYPELYGPANDMYFNLKATACSGLLLLPFSFNFYRIHEGQEFNNKYSYLYNNYRYLKDALDELNLPLNDNEKLYLRHKNKRRFVVNVFYYLIKTRSIRKGMLAIKLSGFKWKDLPDAIITIPSPKKSI